MGTNIAVGFSELAWRPPMPRAGRCFGGPRLGDFLAAHQPAGEYVFSDEKLRDSVGIRPPKLTP
jgi:hypothetical protein